MTSPIFIKVGHAAECLQLVQERTKGVFVVRVVVMHPSVSCFSGHSMCYSFTYVFDFNKNNRKGRFSSQNHFGMITC